MLEELDLWWKNMNIIDNKIINENICIIENSNINELNYIKSQITSVSQVKSITLKKIRLSSNTYNIKSYGDYKNLNNKLLKKNISLNLDDKKCMIMKI